ncbi:MAG TPA: ribose 5-phosphate isomerase A [Nitrososphaeraceae archaeon]|nr:ribose 5-phosphate isomerase A [Nitrososphaeraceae archaeon]
MKDSYEQIKKDNDKDGDMYTNIDNSGNDINRLNSNRTEETNIRNSYYNLALDDIIEKFFINFIKRNEYLKSKEKDNYESVDDNDKEDVVIGLGSGSTVALLVERIAELDGKEKFGWIPTSYQIKMVAEQCGLRFLDESRINEIDLVIDGADQIDEKLNMIKGGGGALFKEKILMYSAKQKVILADSQKFVPTFSLPIPIEVHPFGRVEVTKKLDEIGGYPKIRFLKKGYPFITENGNFILDTEFKNLMKKYDIAALENKIKSIPGVIEVGIFSSTKNTTYYCVNSDGSFSTRTS